jgi:hypothetical protein
MAQFREAPVTLTGLQATANGESAVDSELEIVQPDNYWVDLATTSVNDVIRAKQRLVYSKTRKQMTDKQLTDFAKYVESKRPEQHKPANTGQVFTKIPIYIDGDPDRDGALPIIPHTIVLSQAAMIKRSVTNAIISKYHKADNIVLYSTTPKGVLPGKGYLSGSVDGKNFSSPWGGVSIMRGQDIVNTPLNPLVNSEIKVIKQADIDKLNLKIITINSKSTYSPVGMDLVDFLEKYWDVDTKQPKTILQKKTEIVKKPGTKSTYAKDIDTFPTVLEVDKIDGVFIPEPDDIIRGNFGNVKGKQMIIFDHSLDKIAKQIVASPHTNMWLLDNAITAQVDAFGAHGMDVTDGILMKNNLNGKMAGAIAIERIKSRLGEASRAQLAIAANIAIGHADARNGREGWMYPQIKRGIFIPTAGHRFNKTSPELESHFITAALELKASKSIGGEIDSNLLDDLQGMVHPDLLREYIRPGEEVLTKPMVIIREGPVGSAVNETVDGNGNKLFPNQPDMNKITISAQVWDSSNPKWILEGFDTFMGPDGTMQTTWETIINPETGRFFEKQRYIIPVGATVAYSLGGLDNLEVTIFGDTPLIPWKYGEPIPAKFDHIGTELFESNLYALDETKTINTKVYLERDAEKVRVLTNRNSHQFELEELNRKIKAAGGVKAIDKANDWGILVRGTAPSLFAYELDLLVNDVNESVRVREKKIARAPGPSAVARYIDRGWIFEEGGGVEGRGTKHVVAFGPNTADMVNSPEHYSALLMEIEPSSGKNLLFQTKKRHSFVAFESFPSGHIEVHAIANFANVNAADLLGAFMAHPAILTMKSIDFGLLYPEGAQFVDGLVTRMYKEITTKSIARYSRNPAIADGSLLINDLRLTATKGDGLTVMKDGKRINDPYVATSWFAGKEQVTLKEILIRREVYGTAFMMASEPYWPTPMVKSLQTSLANVTITLTGDTLSRNFLADKGQMVAQFYSDTLRQPGQTGQSMSNIWNKWDHVVTQAEGTVTITKDNIFIYEEAKARTSVKAATLKIETSLKAYSTKKVFDQKLQRWDIVDPINHKIRFYDSKGKIIRIKMGNGTYKSGFTPQDIALKKFTGQTLQAIYDTLDNNIKKLLKKLEVLKANGRYVDPSKIEELKNFRKNLYRHNPRVTKNIAKAKKFILLAISLIGALFGIAMGSVTTLVLSAVLFVGGSAFFAKEFYKREELIAKGVKEKDRWKYWTKEMEKQWQRYDWMHGLVYLTKFFSFGDRTMVQMMDTVYGWVGDAVTTMWRAIPGSEQFGMMVADAFWDVASTTGGRFAMDLVVGGIEGISDAVDFAEQQRNRILYQMMFGDGTVVMLSHVPVYIPSAGEISEDWDTVKETAERIYNSVSDGFGLGQDEVYGK